MSSNERGPLLLEWWLHWAPTATQPFDTWGSVPRISDLGSFEILQVHMSITVCISKSCTVFFVSLAHNGAEYWARRNASVTVIPITVDAIQNHGSFVRQYRSRPNSLCWSWFPTCMVLDLAKYLPMQLGQMISRWLTWPYLSGHFAT